MKLERIFISYFVTLLLAVAPAVANQQQNKLEVVQDQKSGLISIHAENVSLTEVMWEVSAVTGLIVKTSNRDILNEYVTIDLKNISLKQVVDRLLYGVNSVFFYASKPTQTATPRLTKVMLLSRKEGLPAATISNQSQESGRGIDIRSPAKETLLKTILATELGRSILEDNSFATQRILQQLLETGTPEEIKTAVEAMGNLMLDPSFYGQASNGHAFYEALSALKKLDLKGTENYLTKLLQTSEEPWVQSLAAENLGGVGQAESAPPSTNPFASDNTNLRNSAASSLAQIGDARGIAQLLQAIKNGDPASQQLIVHTMAFAGSLNTKIALSQAIAQKQVPQEALSNEILFQLGQQNSSE